MRSIALTTLLLCATSCAGLKPVLADEICRRAAVQSAEIGASFAPMFASEPDLMADYQFCSMIGRQGAPDLVVACMTAVDHVAGRFSVLARYAMMHNLALRHGMPAPSIPDGVEPCILEAARSSFVRERE